MSDERRVVVTDLDGCLLDAETYSWEAARPALDVLRARGIPLVLCSSKTRAEMAPLHAELGLDAPYVFENGGGVVLRPAAAEPAAAGAPGDSVLRLGIGIAELVQALDEIARESRSRLRGFSRLSDSEVAGLTGLPEARAALARRREHDEPFLIDAGDERGVSEAAARRGLRVTRGGRFHHLTGEIDKGQALRRVLSLLGPASSIGLGDARNDIALLGAVERPILVPRPDGSVDPALAAAFPAAERAPLPGPAGWSLAVLAAVGQPLATPAGVARR